MITDDLKLVVPLRDNIHAYHTPISEGVFRANFKILAATKATLSEHGLAYMADVGPRIAALTLVDEGKREAQRRGDFDGDMGAQALLAEIKRLTLILCPGDSGWSQVPVDSAIKSGQITQAEWEEAEAALVFFTSLYALAPQSKKGEVIEAVAGILSASTTASKPMEWTGSSPTSTSAEPFEKAASSVPS